jgi:hypothetical protein
MGGDLAGARHFKDAASCNTKKFCSYIGGHKRLDVLSRVAIMGPNFLNV